MSSLDNVNTCGTAEVVIFILTVISGTANGVLAKVLMSITTTETEDEAGSQPHTEESFDKPLFLTSAMFVGMLLVLPMHWAVTVFKLDFPGYEFDKNEEEIPSDNGGVGPDRLEATTRKSTPDSDSARTPVMHLYFILAILAVCDLLASAMFMIGLQYLDASIQQTLCGSQIIFIALLKHNALKQYLLKFHWVGVFWNTVSVALVGTAALLPSVEGEEGRKDVPTPMIVLGVCLILFGSFTQAVQTVIEERVVKMDDSAPPLLVTGIINYLAS